MLQCGLRSSVDAESGAPVCRVWRTSAGPAPVQILHEGVRGLFEAEDGGAGLRFRGEVGCAHQGKFALVDEEAFERVSQYSWSGVRGRSCWYARAWLRRPDGRTKLALHRFIMGVDDSSTLVDHRNGDGLDCRKENLRVVTESQNRMNTRKKRGGSTYKGVALLPNGKFRAVVRAFNKIYYLGRFDTPEEAARAYDAEARRMHGQHGRYNFPEPGERAARP